VRDADREAITTTDLSLQDAADSTLLSNPQPSEPEDGQLARRVDELERTQDALLARIRLLEKGKAPGAAPRAGLWLLFLPALALLWWLLQKVGG
jgi:hypothetical protein